MTWVGRWDSDSENGLAGRDSNSDMGWKVENSDC